MYTRSLTKKQFLLFHYYFSLFDEDYYINGRKRERKSGQEIKKLHQEKTNSPGSHKNNSYFMFLKDF